MEKSQATTKSNGLCEKIHKAIHRISRRSRSPSPASAPTKHQASLKKLVAPHQAGPAEGNIPVQSSIMLNGKEKEAKPSVSVQNKGRVIISSPKIQPSSAGQYSLEDKAKPAAQTQKTNPTTVTVHIQGHEDETATKNELLLSQLENVKASVASSQGHPNKVTSKKEAKPAVVSAEEKVKPNQKAETAARAPLDMIVIESHGQGVYVKPKVEPAKPHKSMHEELQKPKDQPASTMTKIMATPRYGEVGEGKKPKVSDGADKFTNYIHSVRNKLRTKSDIGEETIAERPPTRTVTKRDSFNDGVANFINRARKNFGITSNV